MGKTCVALLSLASIWLSSASTAYSWCHGFHSHRQHVLYLMHLHLINDAVYQEGSRCLINIMLLIARSPNNWSLRYFHWVQFNYYRVCTCAVRSLIPRPLPFLFFSLCNAQKKINLNLRKTKQNKTKQNRTKKVVEAWEWGYAVHSPVMCIKHQCLFLKLAARVGAYNHGVLIFMGC